MRRILGIDPSTNIIGFAILEENKILKSGIIKLKQTENHYKKLQIIYEQIKQLIKEFNPTEVAIESPFYGKNVQSMLKLGRVQGIIIAISLHHNIPITEYSPRKIKQAITGNGNASKEQVAQMVKDIFGIKKLESYDESDAIAIAYCHKNQKLYQTEKKYKNWSEYLKKKAQK